MRQSLAGLHTGSGVVAGWLLYFVFLTGTLGYFSAEIDRWMQPELPLHGTRPTDSETLERGLARLQQLAPRAERWAVEMPNRKAETPARISWRLPPDVLGNRGARGYETLPPDDNPAARPRQTGGGQLLYQLHYRLHYLPVQQAYFVVGLAAMITLLSLLSGVLTHRRMFRDFFQFRRASGVRSWRDAHTVLGTIALPFHLMISYSGLVLLMLTYMPVLLDEIYRADEASQNEFFAEATPPAPDLPPAGRAAAMAAVGPVLADAQSRLHAAPLVSFTVRNPGDAQARYLVVQQRDTPQAGNELTLYDGVSGAFLQTSVGTRSGARQTRDALYGLHKGQFAGPLLRALYAGCGLLGTALMATGMILWTARRRRSPRRLMERLNAGLIAGLPLGISAYFLANRLIPAQLDGRGSWEAHTLFMAWGLALLFALLRPAGRAWTALLATTAALALLLPLVNAATTTRHLGQTIPWALHTGDWALAGVDLTAIAVGLAFALAARATARATARAAA